MGYMGLGMRKEDYTRKPKRSFDKIKKIYGDTLDFPKTKSKAKIDKPVSFRRKRFKHFGDMAFVKVIKVVFFLVILSLLFLLLVLS